MHITKIISGGQTGADQGGLLAAKFLGIETGGFAPKGYRTEDGPCPWLGTMFGLVDTGVYNYLHRTKLNILHSDITLTFGELEETGTGKTRKLCHYFNKPTIHCFTKDYKHDPDLVFETVKHAIEANDFHVLNIAGNRESVMPGIGMKVEGFLIELIRWRDDVR